MPTTLRPTSRRAHAQERSVDALRAEWERLHALAEAASGDTLSKHERAAIYFQIYADSGGNFMFPLVATHGSLWGVTHTERIERWLRRGLLPLSRRGRVQGWIAALDSVRDINRRVFVEIHTTFHFTRTHGHHPQASAIVDPELLEVYNRAHAACAEGRVLPWETRRDDYYTVFVHEQDDIVDPGLRDAMRGVDPWLVRALRVVRPRFRYFPRRERLRFSDFTDVEQRNREGLRALELAEEVGAERVRQAMSEYG